MQGLRLFTVAACLALLAVGCTKREPERVVDQTGPGQPRRVAFHQVDPDRILVVEVNGVVSVWRVVDPRKPEKLLSIPARAVDAQFLGDAGAIVTGGADGVVRAWKDDGHVLWTSKGGHASGIRALAVSRSAKRVASAGEDGAIRVWTLDGSSAGAPLTDHEGIVLSVTFSPRGDRLASEGSDTTLRLWNRRARGGGYESAGVFRAPIRKYRSMLPNLIKMDAQWGWDRSVAFSPQGTLLAAAGFDGTVRLWNLDGTQRGRPLRGHDGHHVRAIAFSPRGDLLATAGFNRRVRLWKLDGRPYGAPFVGHEGAVSSVAFSPRGDRLVTAGLDHTVRVWGLDGSRLGMLPRGPIRRRARLRPAKE